jgi:serine/threonine protein kinase
MIDLKGNVKEVVLKKVKQSVSGAQEMAEMEHILNVYTSKTARGYVADFIGYCEVGQDDYTTNINNNNNNRKLTPGLWLIWEYQGNKTLAYYLRRRDTIEALGQDMDIEDLDQIVPTVIKQILECLVQLHSSGVVHRDVKPSNIIFCERDGRFKLIDLGAAADLRSGTNYEPSRTIMDPIYCPPEEYILPTNTMDIAASAAPVRLAMSPFLWANHRPQCFDTWSVGIILLQLSLPFLKSSSALKNWTGTFRRWGYDMEEWRARSALPARNTKILDANDGLGWGLAEALLRPRAIETDDDTGDVYFLSSGGKKRLTAEEALAHPFIVRGANKKVGRRSRSGLKRLSSLGSYFLGPLPSSSTGDGDEKDDEEGKEMEKRRRKSVDASQLSNIAKKKNRQQQQQGGGEEEEEVKASVLGNLWAVVSGSGSGSKGCSKARKEAAAAATSSSSLPSKSINKPAMKNKQSMWKTFKDRLYSLEARISQQASATETQTAAVVRLEKEVAVGKASKEELIKATSLLTELKTGLTTSVGELDSLYSSARTFLSVVTGSGSRDKIKEKQRQLEEAEAALLAKREQLEMMEKKKAAELEEALPFSSSSSNSNTAVDALYQSLKITSKAVISLADMAAAAKADYDRNKKQQEEANQARKAAQLALVNTIEAINISATSSWQQVESILAEKAEAEGYNSLSTVQRRNVFSTYVDALIKAQAASKRRAAVAFDQLLGECVKFSDVEYTSFTEAHGTDARFLGVSSAEGKLAFTTHIAALKAQEEADIISAAAAAAKTAEVAARLAAEQALADKEREQLHQAEIAFKALMIEYEDLVAGSGGSWAVVQRKLWGNAKYNAGTLALVLTEGRRRALFEEYYSILREAGIEDKEEGGTEEEDDVDDQQEMKYLKSEQAKLREEYKRMSLKLKDVEKQLRVQSLLNVLNIEGDGPVMETVGEDVIFKFGDSLPPTPATTSTKSAGGGKSKGNNIGDEIEKKGRKKSSVVADKK